MYIAKILPLGWVEWKMRVLTLHSLGLPALCSLIAECHKTLFSYMISLLLSLVIGILKWTANAHAPPRLQFKHNPHPMNTIPGIMIFNMGGVAFSIKMQYNLVIIGWSRSGNQHHEFLILNLSWLRKWRSYVHFDTRAYQFIWTVACRTSYSNYSLS